MADCPEFRDYAYINAILKLIDGEIKFGLWSPENGNDEVAALPSDKKLAKEKLEQLPYILVPLDEGIRAKRKRASQTIWSIDREKLKKFEPIAEYWSPVEDQIHAATCTAAAGVSLLEYFQRKGSGTHEDLSKRFLYTVTRKLMRDEVIAGATVRQTIAAMALFGVPPERYWRYQTEALNEEPDAFCYGLAKNFRATSYIRLDRPRKSPKNLVNQIKVFIAAGYPVMFGLWVYESLLKKSRDSFFKPQKECDHGLIPFPERNEKCIGSHALIAVGFDDKKEAFKIRNSWGREWGEDGYGWLPYEHVSRGLTFDWWSILTSEYIDTTIFSLTENEHMVPSRSNDPPLTR